ILKLRVEQQPGSCGRRSGVFASDGRARPLRNRLHFASIRLSQSLVPKVTVASALHDGLRARELYVGTQSLGHCEVRAADRQESELRLTQLLVELSVPASRNIDLEGIL